MSVLDDWIARAQQERVSDVHIVAGLPVRGRVDGRLLDLTETPMSWEDCENVGRELAGSRFSEIERMGEVDLAKSFPCGVRTRINLFRQQGSLSAAIRLLADRIPELEELQLPPAVSNFENYRTGIVLVTGETGSGKSTTLASVLNRINHTRQAHIITLEDPIEYVYTPDKCVINQRQIGADTRSYADGLRSILREDPDVILIGEMRDLNTIETALTAAETGHLVFATLHTNSAADAIDRIVNVFPEGQQKQIRLQLSTTLRAVLSQQLLPRKSGKGRVAACEVMIVNSAIRNLIREGKTPQMESFMAMNAQNGSILMDAALQRLVRDGSVSQQTALSYARDPENFGKLR
ncbi:MAG: PilT/PilU family type 4a pilus ATPase [Candidatus Faecousia sp.]|nr:PilT/PilU family type 4a pilus ATPase [Candidatus Faecousia sp.]